jgi:hypothetical protein
MNLYQINNEINELILNCDESGEIDATKFDQLTIEKEKKQENIIFVLLNQDAELDAYDAEIKRLKTQKERLEKKNEWLKKYLQNSMDSEEIKFGIHGAKIGLNPESVEIENQDILPANFIVIKTTSQPDKNAIKEALKSGQDVAGAKLIRTIKLKIN